ncbi:MAG: DUF4124 domain-containing protein [Comamonadaceae bacterium]|jgi:hypothetical protein|nr:DUF4124 domain-containing protein [Comamonadaceae bacterium]
MKTHRILLALAACWFSVNAMAQWQWLDKDGRKVFSDRPPPADIPDSRILQQPQLRQPTAKPAATESETSSAAPTAAKAPAKDKELEEKKAKQDAEQAAQAKAEEARQAAVRADNCERARRAKTTYESGRRLAQTNAQGEKVIVDETMRAAEVQRLDGIISSNCR